MLVFSNFGFSASHEKGIEEVRSKDFTCSELQELVQEEGAVKIRSFGSALVYSNANDCVDDLPVHDDFQVFRSTWNTMDKFFCVVGYRCNIINSGR